MSSLVAKANTGTGTDSLAGFSVPDGFAGAVVPVDGAGNVAIPALLNSGASSTVSAPPVRLASSPIWTCSFAGVGASLLSSDFTLMAVGSGVGYSQAGGSLLVTTGTTANSEWLARSVTSWTGTVALRFSTILSQRIANQNFAVLLADIVGDNLSCTINSATSITVTKTSHGFTAANVGQSMFVGGISGAAGVPGRYAIASIPSADTINFTVAGWPASGSCTVDLFGWNHVKHLYNGVTATAMVVDAQRNGWASGDTTATINTTASPGHIGLTSLAGRDVYFDDALRASATVPVFSTRASRYENIPDEETPLYVFLWSYNGTTAPASTSTWTVGFVSVEPHSNQSFYLQGAKQQGAASPVPVAVPSGVVVNSGTVTTVTTVGSMTSGNLGIPGIIADVASAALTTTTTTAALTPTFGAAYEVNIPVTVVSGTTPTLDVGVEESDDTGTNWVRVYDFPRITATGFYRSPKLPLTGNRVRYVQTVAGTTPSFTRAINRLQSSESVAVFRQRIDRSIVLTTLDSATAILTVQGCRNLQMVLNLGAATTVPTVQMEATDDGGATWYPVGNALTGVASGTVSVIVNGVSPQQIRGRVSVAGATVTAGYLLLKGY